MSSTTAGSSWATEADQPSEKEKAEKAEKQDKKSNPNFIVKESQKQYTRSKYVNSLRVGVRLVLPCGRYNFFYEVKIEKISILFFRFLENAFFSRCNNSTLLTLQCRFLFPMTFWFIFSILVVSSYYVEKWSNSGKNFAVNHFTMELINLPKFEAKMSHPDSEVNWPPIRVDGVKKGASASYPPSLSSIGKNPKEVYIYGGKSEAKRPKSLIRTSFCDWRFSVRDQVQNVFTIAIRRYHHQLYFISARTFFAHTVHSGLDIVQFFQIFY